MPKTFDRIEMSSFQREAVGQVMADAIGSNIQSGRFEEIDGAVYVMWKFGTNLPTFKAIITQEGTVTYAKDN